MHHLSMRLPFLEANLAQAEADFQRDGSCLLEPRGDRSAWVRIESSPGLGLMPSVHVNHTHGRFTSHGDVCYGAASDKTHPHWGESSRWWPG